jgi:hypothetical protein
MPKTKISEFSATPANNTDIDSINIAEGCAPSGINDAIRELMSQLKDFQTGAVGDSFNGPVGSTTATTGAFTTLTTTGTINLLTVGRGASAVATNTAVGASALAANTTGAAQVAVGNSALDACTTGNRNTAVGDSALGGVTTGDNNLGLGRAAGLALTTGVNNTFVGAYNGSNGGCGELITTGSKNTILGTYNGNQGSLDIRTASNYIVLSDGDGNPRAQYGVQGPSFGEKGWRFEGDLASAAFVNCSEAVQVRSNRSGNQDYAFLISSNTTTNNASAFRFYSTTSSSVVGSITYSGSATAYNTSSDYRLKNTVVPMTGALAKVAQLKPVTYKWNFDGSDGQGFIAHELAEVMPDAVTGEKDAMDENGNPKYQGIDTSFLVATLTAAIQELKAEFDAYKASHP